MVGQITAVSITTAIIAQSTAPGQLQARVFIVFAACSSPACRSSPASTNTADPGEKPPHQARVTLT
jgi:hypothetical protein